MSNQVRLPGPFGLCMTGTDIGKLSPSALRGMADSLFSHRILVLPGQELTSDDYVRFGRLWGDPVLLIDQKSRLGSHPEIIVQSNATKVAPAIRNVAAHWHCDSSYEEIPATITMLYGEKAPLLGGETLFCDLVGAYEALPLDLRDRIDGLSLRHAVGAARAADDEYLIPFDTVPQEVRKGVTIPDPVVPPLVRTHPVTGRKGLYGLGGTPFAVVGMAEQEGAALIADLKRHATQPRFVQSYKLMPNDILIWDNFSVMHRATMIKYSDEPAEARLNYRISLKGLPKFLS